MVFNKLAISFVHPFEQFLYHLVEIRRPAVLPVPHGDEHVVHVTEVDMEQPLEDCHEVDDVRLAVIHAARHVNPVDQFHSRRFLVRPVQFLVCRQALFRGFVHPFRQEGGQQFERNQPGDEQVVARGELRFRLEEERVRFRADLRLSPFEIEAVPVRRPAPVVLEEGEVSLEELIQLLHLALVIARRKSVAGRAVALYLVQFVEVQQPPEELRLAVLEEEYLLRIVLKFMGEREGFQFAHFLFQISHHFTAAWDNILSLHIDRSRVAVNILQQRIKKFLH